MCLWGTRPRESGEEDGGIGEGLQAVPLGRDAHEVAAAQQPLVIVGVQPDLSCDHVQGGGRGCVVIGHV